MKIINTGFMTLVISGEKGRGVESGKCSSSVSVQFLFFQHEDWNKHEYGKIWESWVAAKVVTFSIFLGHS